MNPQEQNQPGPAQPAVHNPLSVMQPGEKVICEIKRHPIGIFGIYIACGLLLVVLAVLAFIAAPNFFGNGDNRGQIMAITGAAYIIFTIVALGFVFVSNLIYWGNRWVLTSDSITQVAQTGLFSKQSSQLSLGSLEDVTAEQNGILAHMFNFGVIKAESAGERSKFIFLYCPNPNYYAQKVLAAREVFEQNRRGQEPAQQPQPTENAYQPPEQSSQPDSYPEAAQQTPLDYSSQNQTPPAYPTEPPAQSPPSPPAYPPQDAAPDGSYSYPQNDGSTNFE